jgi:hypothetical protein
VIIFEPIAKPLLFLHLVSAIVCLATAVHLALRLFQNLRAHRLSMHGIRLHAKIVAPAYLISFVLGAMVYPTFRVRVRHDYFDPQLPWATAMFEMKEHCAALGLLPALLLLYIALHFDFAATRDRVWLPLFCVVLGVLTLMLGYNACAGWYLSSLRSV